VYGWMDGGMDGGIKVRIDGPMDRRLRKGFDRLYCKKT